VSAQAEMRAAIASAVLVKVRCTRRRDRAAQHPTTPA
jgi:hypothetical protein